MDGYYDHLLRQMETALSEHFMRPMHRNIWQVATTAADVVTLCETTPLWDPNVSKFAAL